MEKTGRKKVEIFLVAILFATAFFVSFLCFFASSGFGLKTAKGAELTNNENYQIFENNVLSKTLNNGETQYFLTIKTDMNCSEVAINGIDLPLSVMQGIDEDQNVYDYKIGSELVLENDNVFLTYSFANNFTTNSIVAYKTDFAEEIFAFQNDEFKMPQYDLTIEISSKLITKTITINQIMFDNSTENNGDNTIYHTSQYGTTFLVADFGTNKEVVFSAEDLHLFANNGKYFISTFHSNDSGNQFENQNVITLAEENYTFTLKIDNIVNDDTIDIYIERDYHFLTFHFGTNEEYDDGVGGSINIFKDNALQNQEVFCKSIVQNVMTCYIYKNSDLYVNVLASVGYRYKSTIIDFEDESDKGYLAIEYLDNENKVKISNINKSLQIYVAFLKTYKVGVCVEEIEIEGQMLKIGTINFENETKTYDDLNRYYDIHAIISIQTQIDDGYEIYEFKKWKVLDFQNNEVDISSFGIVDESLLLQNTIRVLDLTQDVKFVAVYGIKQYSITIVWNGFFGTIESETEHQNYVYSVLHSESLVLKLIPQNNMHFLKKARLRNDAGEIENVESLEKFDTYSIFEISNITGNLDVEIEFVKNTWWEHIEIFQLYGAGTEAIPYFITSPSDLAIVAYLVNNNIRELQGTAPYKKAHYLLYCDVDCGHDYYFVPIGTSRNPFEGVFDYQYHSITNIWTEEDAEKYQHEGLFDVLGANAKIINKTRSRWPIINSIVGSIIIFSVAGVLVFIIEKFDSRAQKIVIADQEQTDIEKVKGAKLKKTKQKRKNKNKFQNYR